MELLLFLAGMILMVGLGIYFIIAIPDPAVMMKEARRLHLQTQMAIPSGQIIKRPGLRLIAPLDGAVRIETEASGWVSITLEDGRVVRLHPDYVPTINGKPMKLSACPEQGEPA